MPHMSPLDWLLMTVLFWVSLLTFTTMLWWQQTPNFPIAMNWSLFTLDFDLWHGGASTYTQP